MHSHYVGQPEVFQPSKTNILSRNVQNKLPPAPPKLENLEKFQNMDQSQIRSKFPSRQVAMETGGQTSVLKKDRVEEFRLGDNIFTYCYYKFYYFGEKTYGSLFKSAFLQVTMLVLLLVGSH